MVESARDRMNAGIRGLMRDYPRDDTPAYGDVPTGYMLTRNANGKVVVVPSNKYTPSTGARPDQKLTIGPNGEVVSSPHMSPALDKALEVAQGNANPVLSFGETGMADPSGASFFTPQYTDEDFSRSLALQHPLNRATTQEDIDEEARLKANLALSAREKQQQSQGSFWGGDQLLTKDRIEQMYGKPSADIPATAKVILQQRSAPASAAPTTPTTSATATPSISSLPLMARANSGADPAPDNIGTSSLPFGIPGISTVPGNKFDAASMPVQLNNADYTRFSIDAPPTTTRAAAPARQTQPSRAPINSGNPIDLTTRQGSSTSSTPAPATEQGNKSLLSSILGRLTPQDPYAGMSRSQMGAKAQEMQSSGDEYGANLLTQRLDRSITSPDQQSSDGNFKRGGTAGGGQKSAGMHKDAALHKALDIIHAMLTRGH